MIPGISWLQIGIVAAVVGTAGTTGWKVGHARGVGSMERQLTQVKSEARTLIGQCRSEVEKINKAQRSAADALAEELMADRSRSVAAQKEMNAVAKYVAEQQALNMSLLRQAEGMLKNAEDTCSGTLVDDDFHRLLEQLANPPALRDDGLPAGEAGEAE